MAREADAIIMQQCLALARSVEGRTAPNPMVAAIVLDENAEVVGRGCHERTGMPHAERNALLQAGDRARGGTIYVSLEPCCHQGKTPPCTDALIESGVKKVVAAMEDPNPKVSGKGFSILKDNGIEVVENVLSEEAAWLNRGFISGITRGRPWLLLKMAMTLDGRIADRNGQSRWITGPEARAYVHDLRNRFDAVL
ncbi:MAG: bifunctional diaminohydroxyphosphoribosylaminopyrimidine deaminase/5-amino-6-(5-phosphoribosylamino)uracil reductase RibD, partial [Candidatus Obscuribacterales bacterium]|nr:bifunctional diaminohydroxyphosphoribosylaminopyrimidine deaminase/5-amino-6-(5-phosphoribosylamino)uracil reductase RibD [Candidatus Obscuribacterales bacterium]